MLIGHTYLTQTHQILRDVDGSEVSLPLEDCLDLYKFIDEALLLHVNFFIVLLGVGYTWYGNSSSIVRSYGSTKTFVELAATETTMIEPFTGCVLFVIAVLFCS